MINVPILIFFSAAFGSCYCEIDHDVGIIGGHQITIDTVPFMVSLRIDGTHHWCGGSIIHQQFVLTTAHCIVQNKTYKVLVGTDRADNSGSGYLYDVEKIIVHENYSNKTFKNDACLMKLKQPLNLGPDVAIIQLADSSEKLNKYTKVNVTGWGSTGLGVIYSTRLQQVTIPIISRRHCQLLYFPFKLEITNQMICAGIKGRDSCQGDSGGPLTKGSLQVGITSFGVRGCGDQPGVYTKVSAVKPWIEQKINENL